MTANTLAEILPKTKVFIYDVVKSAGIDVSGWHETKGNANVNPSFCYRWAFEGKESVVLCLWYHDITLYQDSIISVGNARQDSITREAEGSDHWDKSVRDRCKRWASRAFEMDEVLKAALRKKLTVRVCVVSKTQKTIELGSNKADYRKLDEMPWSLDYDMMTGAYQVTRGSAPVLAPQVSTNADESIASPREGQAGAFETALVVESVAPELPEITSSSYGIGVVDQFANEAAIKLPKEVLVYERSPRIRQAALARSGGRCEWCLQPGFEMADGQVYLESHHIKPLAEDGTDSIDNVIALCPNDHRQAHYGANRAELAIEMLALVARLNCPSVH